MTKEEATKFVEAAIYHSSNNLKGCDDCPAVFHEEYCVAKYEKYKEALEMIRLPEIRPLTVSVGENSYTLHEIIDAVVALAKAYDEEVDAHDRRVSMQMEIEEELADIKKTMNELPKYDYCDFYNIEGGQPVCFVSTKHPACNCEGHRKNCTFYKN